MVFTHSWCAWQPSMLEREGRGRVWWGEEDSLQGEIENERWEKKRKIRLAPSQQRDTQSGDGQERERKRGRQSELGSVLLPALCLFGVSCFSDSAAGSMELEPQRFSTLLSFYYYCCVLFSNWQISFDFTLTSWIYGFYWSVSAICWDCVPH